MLGLIASPDREVARAALETELADPDHPIDGSFLYSLRMVFVRRRKLLMEVAAGPTKYSRGIDHRLAVKKLARRWR
jgi:hypothetical protein